jgi:hypothetical protein
MIISLQVLNGWKKNAEQPEQQAQGYQFDLGCPSGHSQGEADPRCDQQKHYQQFHVDVIARRILGSNTCAPQGWVL